MNNELFAPLKKTEFEAIKGGFSTGYPQASSAVNLNGAFNQNNDTVNNSAFNNDNVVTGSFNTFIATL